MAKAVVLLTASWCPRCPAARRLWKDLRTRYGFNYREFDIDSSEGQEAAIRYGIQAVPSVIVGGEVWNEVLDEARALQRLQENREEHQPADWA
jgi:thioredoxin 1